MDDDAHQGPAGEPTDEPGSEVPLPTTPETDAPQIGAPAPGASDEESAYDLLQRGRELLARRHHAQAAVVLGRAALIEPHRGSILEPLGRAYFMSGQVERAVETFEALLAVDPSSHYGHYVLGRALIRLGRHDEGRVHLRLAAALAPDSPLYRGGLNRLGDRGRRPPPGTPDG